MSYQVEDRLSKTSKRSKSHYGDVELFSKFIFALLTFITPLASPKPRRNVMGLNSPDIGIVNIADLRDIRAKTILGKKHDAAMIH